MDLGLSRRSSYVVRSALCLATAHGGGRLLTRQQIAADSGISRAFVSQILGDLIRAGLAYSTAGKAGGYRLARRPEEVTILDVVEAGSGTLQTSTCPLDDHPCADGAACALHDALDAGARSLRDELRKTTLADVLARAVTDEAVETDGPGRVAVRATEGRPVPTVTVADSVRVELAPHRVAGALRADTSWLATHAVAATEEGRSVRLRVGPGRSEWLGKAVVVHLSPPEGTDGDLRVALRWEPTGLKGLFPKLDGELHLAALDDGCSELTLTGTYHPPFGRAGSVIDDALLTKVADATIRSLLHRVADTVAEMAAR